MQTARTFVAVAVALLAPTVALAAPSPIKVAVIDIRANGTDESSAKTLTDVLVVEVARIPGVSVVSDAELASLLSLEQRKQMVGCEEDASCAAEIAGALGVDKICSGTLGKLEATQVLTLRLIDVKTAKTDYRVFEPVEGGAAKFIGRMAGLVAQLFPDRVAATASRPAPTSAAPSGNGSALSLGGVVLYDPSPALAPTPATAPTPPPAQPVRTAAPVAADPGPAMNPWLWLGGGVVLTMAGLLWAAAATNDAELILPGTLATVGVIAVLASPVICGVNALGGGDDGPPPLDSPFAVPDAPPERRVSVIAVPASP